VFRTTFWQFFSLLWEIFVNIFRTTGFSTVSLGSYLMNSENENSVFYFGFDNQRR
jgi:hypothetical protein